MSNLPIPQIPSNSVPLTPNTHFNTLLTSTPGNYFAPYPASLSSTPIPQTPIPKVSSHHRKDKENLENPLTPSGPLLKKQKTKRPLSVFDKLQKFYAFLKHDLDWSYGELLFHTSQDFTGYSTASNPLLPTNSNAARATREQMVTVMTHFFNGNGQYTPANILLNWIKHPYGRLQRDSPLMYSTSIPYNSIKPVRPALTSFAAQIVQDKLVDEAEDAIKVSSGLHLSLSDHQTASKKLEWTDIGSATVERTQQIIQTHQPLTWNLFMKLAARPPRSQDGVKVVRIKRPPELAVTGVISTLNFARTSRAKLLPLATGILYFGSSASTDLFRYRSRMAEMPSYGSVIRAMRSLSEHEAAVTLEHGRDPNSIGIIRLDNVQNYLLQRDHAIGRENQLNIGLAATYYEINLDGTDINVFNLENKATSLAKNLRSQLTVAQLQKMIDTTHLENIGVLHWVKALADWIPELGHLKPEISLLFHTRVAKQRLKVEQSKSTHWLRTGQTADAFKPRLFPVGGDGLTFEKMVQLKEYLQFEENAFELFETMEPILEWWHTEWTNLSRLFESHWGSSLSRDPSSLGNSAEKIGRKKPSNLKKVDYYTSAELAYLVLDARLLDCWRLSFGAEDLLAHFKDLALKKNLPSLEDLQIQARKLYRAYTSLRGQDKAIYGGVLMNGSGSVVPHGTESARHIPGMPTSNNIDTAAPAKKFDGDQVLARSVSFMRDAMFAREMTLATADGDVGRIWEIIKVMLFTFAGSSHSNYTKYLLEMITKIELEANEDLRKALLQITLVNLSGREGHWSAGDFIQEYFNRLLEAIVQRKGVEYGDKFVRQTWSRNIHHVARLKLSWFDAVGLQSRSGTHTGAKQDAELRILLEHYKASGLHSFYSGRTFDTEPFVDDFYKGMRKLQDGKLEKWIQKTTSSRINSSLTGILPSTATPETLSQLDQNVNEDSDSDTDSEEIIHDEAPQKHGQLIFPAIINDSLVLRTIDIEAMEARLYQDDSDADSEDDGIDSGA
ncbi:hypothetical protein BJ912DRAFT_1060520 [Pholiota molesta]|nr:hypothetical protein BJ912DRAFT_1060520 [Pholiota molesta]